MTQDKQNNAHDIHWHALEINDVQERLKTSPEGLSESEVAKRLEEYGRNVLRPPKRRTALMRFLLQFHNVLIYILLLAGIGTAFLQHWIDTGVIFGVVVINALIGFIQEGKAEKALEAISHMLSLEATVIRGDKRRTLPAEEIVPGDVVILRAGDKVPADIRLIDTRELRIDESMLTGESVSAEKGVEPLDEKTGLGDRKCLAYSGTLVTSGQGTGIVVATGNNTELGRISEMVSETETITTPLIHQMDQFGKVLAMIIIALAVTTFGIGYFLKGTAFSQIFLAAVALAVAAIPEGLPAIMTITLAIGVQRMAGRHAIIRHLPAVDTLGALTVVCSDKTGTLTRNEMTVTAVATATSSLSVTGVGYEPEGEIQRDGSAVHLENDSLLERLLMAGTLCNEAELRQKDDQWRPEGDPMEGALLAVAMKAGMDIEAVRRTHPPIHSIPFESKNRFMASLHHGPDERKHLFVKGAPERLLEMCDTQSHGGDLEPVDEAFWMKHVEALASEGRRVLALAEGHPTASQDRINFKGIQSGLTLLGLVGIIDPPRIEALHAITDCHEAGIRVVMITGDHAMTARAIGKELGIGDGIRSLTGQELDELDDEKFSDSARDVDVFARVSPEHKLRLVTAIQAQDQVVAMTGDGVNDAPALKRADVGIAMGIKGTEVSKEASDMVLTDDNFVSIAHAIEEGRTVYDNLRKAILFILPTNGGEALTIMAAILLGRTLPLTPVQVLWINMITAVTLALALAFEPSEAGVMKRPPRDPKSGLLDRYFLWRIILVSSVMCAGTFGKFIYMRSLGASEELARTVAVNTMVMFEVFYLINTRYILAPVLNRNGLFGSRPVMIAIVLVIMFQILFTYQPHMQRIFGTASIGLMDWATLTLTASSILFLVELEKWIVRKVGFVRRLAAAG